MLEIKLANGLVTLVDDSDYEDLMRYRWSYGKNGYVLRSFRSKETGKVTSEMMHRRIAEAPKGKQVDHINGNKLDNRKDNLRICSAHENSMNRKKNQNYVGSQYKGVYHNNPGTWAARIMFKQEWHYLGSFKTELEAAQAYDDAANRFFGPFANFNLEKKHG